MSKLPVAVERGAALLDDRLPGWRGEVDPDKLDLSSSCDCVLGELFGGYERGLRILGLTHGQARYFGFLESYSSFYKLTAAWRKLIS